MADEQQTQNSGSVNQTIADELMNQDIIKILKLENLPKEEQDKLRQTMMDTILGRVMARVMDNLTGDDREKFGKLMDAGDTKATEDFLNGKMNIRDIVVQETLLYKAEMIDNSQKIDEMIKSKSK